MLIGTIIIRWYSDDIKIYRIMKENRELFMFPSNFQQKLMLKQIVIEWNIILCHIHISSLWYLFNVIRSLVTQRKRKKNTNEIFLRKILACSAQISITFYCHRCCCYCFCCFMKNLWIFEKLIILSDRAIIRIPNSNYSAVLYIKFIHFSFDCFSNKVTQTAFDPFAFSARSSSFLLSSQLCFISLSNLIILTFLSTIIFPYSHPTMPRAATQNLIGKLFISTRFSCFYCFFSDKEESQQTKSFSSHNSDYLKKWENFRLNKVLSN